MVRQLIKEDGNDYSGKYVATASFNDNIVIASDEYPMEVYRKAEELGYKKPVVFFVPKKDVKYIY